MVTYTKSEKEFEIAPMGNHIAICYRIIDFGTQEVKKFQSEELEHKPQIKFGFEIPAELMGDGKPFIIYSGMITTSLHEKATFRKILDILNGVPMPEEKVGRLMMGQETLDQFLGKPCAISVIHRDYNGSNYANVKGYHPIPKGYTIPKPHNALQCLDLSRFDESVYLALPKSFQEKIALSYEFKNKQPLDDSVPF